MVDLHWKEMLTGFLVMAMIVVGVSFTGEAFQLNVGIHQGLDLALHLMAHLDLRGNPSSNYDPEYVKSINALKEEAGQDISLEKRMKPFAQVINRDMGLSFLLSAMPVFFSEGTAFVDVLEFFSSGDEKLLGNLSSKDKAIAKQMASQFRFGPDQRRLLAEYVKIARDEYEQFFQRYWQQRQENLEERVGLFEQLWHSDGLAAIPEFFARQGISSGRVFLSDGMRRNGRGLNFMGEPAVIARLPQSSEDVFSSLTIAVHELLHQFTDPIVYDVTGYDPSKRSLDPNDSKGMAIHMAVENGVVIAQYWLMLSSSSETAERYLEVVSNWMGKPVSNYSELRLAFPISRELEQALRFLVS